MANKNATALPKSLIAAIVSCHVFLVAWGAYRHSPTIDEPAYLASGISHWKFGRFDLCKVSPPLVRLVAAIPVLAVSPKYDWSNYTIGFFRAEHRVGHDFIAANGSRIFWLFTLARWACLPFSLVGAYVVYRWSRELFGGRAALSALLIWCFSPEMVAHAQLMTPDVAVTSLSLATSYAFWKWSSHQTWALTLLTGAMLGLAVLAKTNAVALYPAMGVMLLARSIVDRVSFTWRAILQFATAVVLSIYVINLGYGFENSMRRFGDFEFASDFFKQIQSPRLASIPIPLPSAFIEGIDLQRIDFENKEVEPKTYFRGQWFDLGWWWFYIYVVLVKVPVGTWVLVAIGTASIFACRSSWKALRIGYVAVPGLALFALASSQTGFGGGLRYVLPSLPFAYIVASSAFASAQKFVGWVSAVALTWIVLSSLFVYPHSLSYFNELAGGPGNGSAHLLDGDFDWGQDLLFVAEWIANHPNAKPLHAAYWTFLHVDPNDLGLKVGPHALSDNDDALSDNDERFLTSGWYLISLNRLRGERRPLARKLSRFLHSTPVDRIGYTTSIFKTD